MKLSEVPFADLRTGDKLVSARGNPGHVVGLFPEGAPNPITGSIHSDLGSGRILICWYGEGRWSMHEHALLDRVTYDEEGSRRFHAGCVETIGAQARRDEAIGAATKTP